MESKSRICNTPVEQETGVALTGEALAQALSDATWPRCPNVIKEGEAFCPKCGARVVWTDEKKPEQANAEPVQECAAEPVQKEASAETPIKKGKSFWDEKSIFVSMVKCMFEYDDVVISDEEKRRRVKELFSQCWRFTLGLVGLTFVAIIALIALIAVDWEDVYFFCPGLVPMLIAGAALVFFGFVIVRRIRRHMQPGDSVLSALGRMVAKRPLPTPDTQQRNEGEKVNALQAAKQWLEMSKMGWFLSLLMPHPAMAAIVAVISIALALVLFPIGCGGAWYHLIILAISGSLGGFGIAAVFTAAISIDSILKKRPVELWQAGLAAWLGNAILLLFFGIPFGVGIAHAAEIIMEDSMRGHKGEENFVFRCKDPVAAVRYANGANYFTRNGFLLVFRQTFEDIDPKLKAYGLKY